MAAAAAAASPTNIGTILVQIFDVYPSLTKGIDYRDFALKEYVRKQYNFLFDKSILIFPSQKSYQRAASMAERANAGRRRRGQCDRSNG